MLQRVRKPKASELRLKALISVGYKLMVAVIRDSFEENIRKNGLGKDLQVGFIAGSRIENNLYILRHCRERPYKLKMCTTDSNFN